MFFTLCCYRSLLTICKTSPSGIAAAQFTIEKEVERIEKWMILQNFGGYCTRLLRQMPNIRIYNKKHNEYSCVKLQAKLNDSQSLDSGVHTINKADDKSFSPDDVFL